MITTSEDINNKKFLEGTLVGRTEDHVLISVRGKKMKIPRNIVAEVKLPKFKTESSDQEIKKLL